MYSSPYDQYNANPQQQGYVQQPMGITPQEQMQQQAFANALRQGSPQYQGLGKNMFSGASLQDMQALGKGISKLNGDNATADYVSEFGKFDPQMVQSLGSDATMMQKFGGLFGMGA